MNIIAGNTPIEKYEFSGKEVWIKREDFNPSGSFKDRLIEYLCPRITAESTREIVLSGSGNMAISLLYFLQQARAANPEISKQVKIFIADNLPESKLTRLMNLVETSPNVELIKTSKPRFSAIQYAKERGALLLLGSRIADAPDAYGKMYQEIDSYQKENGINFDAIVICASSGTAAQGLLEAMLESYVEKPGLTPVYIVQTSHIHPIAKKYDQDFIGESTTAANAISDRIAIRKNKIFDLLDQAGGGAVVVNNEEIANALEALSVKVKPAANQPEFTGNAALGLAGMFKLLRKDYNFSKPLIILSGN